MSYRVVCITKPNPQSSHEHITHIGYFQDVWNPKRVITVEEAIERIDHNKQEFHVQTPYGDAYVEVVRPFGRRPYIKTFPDNTQTDNLLSLHQC